MYLQENGSSLHLIAPNIDITFLNFKKDAEIDFEGASDHYIECEMIQRKVGESHEPDEIYEAFKTALDEKDYDALDSLVETAQQVFSDDEESTRKISKKKKDKSKTKRKIAKASRRKNRK